MADMYSDRCNIRLWFRVARNVSETMILHTFIKIGLLKPLPGLLIFSEILIHIYRISSTIKHHLFIITIAFKALSFNNGVRTRF